MRILVLGALYSNNLGDGVICECVAAILKHHFSDAEIIIMDILNRRRYEPTVMIPYRELKRRSNRDKLRITVTRCGWDKVLTHEKYRVKQCLPYIENICKDNYDMVVIAGGQLYMDRYALFLAAYVNRFSEKKIPIYLNACGMGPVYSKAIKQCFSDTIMNPYVKLISCRDGATLIKRYYTLGKKAVADTYDPALWCSHVYGVKKSQEANVTGLGMMYTNTMNPERVAAFWVRLIRQFEKDGKEWKIFVNGAEDDITFARYVISRIPELEGKIERYCMPVPKRPEDLVKLISQFKSIISFRLHSHIIAAALAVPSVAVVWDDKLNGFFKKIGHPERCITIREKPGSILELLKKAEIEEYDYALIEEQKQYAANLLYAAIDRNIEQVNTI